MWKDILETKNIFELEDVLGAAIRKIDRLVKTQGKYVIPEKDLVVFEIMDHIHDILLTEVCDKFRKMEG